MIDLAGLVARICAVGLRVLGIAGLLPPADTKQTFLLVSGGSRFVVSIFKVDSVLSYRLKFLSLI